MRGGDVIAPSHKEMTAKKLSWGNGFDQIHINGPWSFPRFILWGAPIYGQKSVKLFGRFFVFHYEQVNNNPSTGTNGHSTPTKMVIMAIAVAIRDGAVDCEVLL